MIRSPQDASPLELWGGVECTVNRVGERFHDQLHSSGHHARIEDLDRFTQLGFKRLRYPVLWERCAPDAPGRYAWRWADERLARLRELGVDPIVGLLHHGSGPRYTNLLDDRFAELFAAYAAAAAARYPWVERYTPINEPLTTARFSALYGHWHPHRRDDRSFLRALLNQCRAIVRAMEEIRKINPAALLVQTEDLGRTTSSPRLSYQADFENERRWLSFDLLTGNVDRGHAMCEYLMKSEVSDAELAWFQEHACPPDVIGVNHYVTSDRYLDENLADFPQSAAGGNGRDVYVDVEAVRALPDGAPGLANALREAWNRYGGALAVTETHLGSTREEQLRWLMEFWTTARQLRHERIDVAAVTVWALLGSHDWNSLLTHFEGSYEPGVFDVRGPAPRPTALARLVQELSSSPDRARPGLESEPGWWRRPPRLFASRSAGATGASTATSFTSTLLVTGATGTLGRAFARLCEMRGLRARVCTRRELDICDAASIDRALAQTSPWAVINAAGYVRVDDAERDCTRCYRENSAGAQLLAHACAARGVALLTFSSDLVFDGRQSSPYVESAPAAPLNVYGLSKARAERDVLSTYPEALVVRTSAFFGPWDEYNFVTCALRSLRAGQRFDAIEDIVVSATYVPDLVNASLDLLIDGEHGLWHLVNNDSTSWFELARRAAHISGTSTNRLRPRSWRELQLPARRPEFSALTSERGLVMPNLEHALERYAAAV